jgi:iron only hydrogenase large subunit-like protein
MEEHELPADAQKVLHDLQKKKKIVAMLAPSFVVDFQYPDIVLTLKKMGFDKVCELTFGARIINGCYRRIIKENPDTMFISTTCPVITGMVKERYPKYAKNLIPVVSPIGATTRIMKKNYPKHELFFVAPCPAKREEAKMYGVDITLTFKELKQLIGYFAEKNLFKCPKIKSHMFDKFYEEYTKIYPLSGGLSATMNKHGILTKDKILIAEGPEKVEKLLASKIPENIRFLDILFCKGGCIGGPGIASSDSIDIRYKRVIDYRNFAKVEKMGKHRGLIKDTKGISFATPKEYVDNTYCSECDTCDEKK